MRDYLIEDCGIEDDEIAICHSKLSNRAKQEQRFRSGKAHIMIATSAFGMGVNIPDIRLIIVSPAAVQRSVVLSDGRQSRARQQTRKGAAALE